MTPQCPDYPSPSTPGDLCGDGGGAHRMVPVGPCAEAGERLFHNAICIYRMDAIYNS